MKRIFRLSAIVLLALIGCTPVTWGNGIPRSEQRSTAAFSNIEAHGGIVIILRPDVKESIEVSGDANIVPMIHTDISNDTLRISADARFRNALTPTVVIRKKGVQSIAAKGSPELHIEGPYPAKQLSMKTVDVPAIHASVAAKSIQLDIAGSTTLHLTGTASSATGEFSGMLSADARRLLAKTWDINNQGDCVIDLGAPGKITATSLGSLTVRYDGTPRISRSGIPGSIVFEKRKPAKKS